MHNSIADVIAKKSASLPLDAQREVLEFIEFKLQRQREESLKSIPPTLFRSVQGILKGEFANLAEEIEQMRQESWKQFPRDFSAEGQ